MCAHCGAAVRSDGQRFRVERSWSGVVLYVDDFCSLTCLAAWVAAWQTAGAR
jgi:hypothetical protein